MFVILISTCYLLAYSFMSFFPISIPFLSFSCLALTSTSSLMLTRRSGEAGHPRIGPDVSGKPGFSPWSVMSAVGFRRCSLSNWGRSPLFLVYWAFLSWMVSVLHCVNCCSWMYWYFSFLVCWSDELIYINWFYNVETALHTSDKSLMVVVYDSFYALVNSVC